MNIVKFAAAIAAASIIMCGCQKQAEKKTSFPPTPAYVTTGRQNSNAVSTVISRAQKTYRTGITYRLTLWLGWWG